MSAVVTECYVIFQRRGLIQRQGALRGVSNFSEKRSYII